LSSRHGRRREFFAHWTSPPLKRRKANTEVNAAVFSSRERFYVAAAAFVGALALVLALVGVYGAVSYGLLQRPREMAFGWHLAPRQVACVPCCSVKR
jgi:hypothetical protein